MLKGPKHCLNLRESIFVIFIAHSEGKSAPNQLLNMRIKYDKNTDVRI